MNQLQFSVEIHTPKQHVWNTLWQDVTFRDWAGIVDPGTHMVGELKEGSEVQFISANGYGVTSLIEKLTPGKFLLLRHSADTQDSGANTRKKQWSGGTESYRLSEKDGITTLVAAFDVPTELEAIFNESYPKALARVKALAERER